MQNSILIKATFLRSFLSAPQFVWRQGSLVVKHKFCQWLRIHLREESAGRETFPKMTCYREENGPYSHPEVFRKQVILKTPGAPRFGISLRWESPTLAGGFPT